MIGVNGWCSANQASGPGIESVGTNAAAQERQEQRNIGRLLAVSTLFVDHPERHRQPGDGERRQREQADRREPGRQVRSSGGSRSSTATTTHDRHREHGLDDAAEDVAGEDDGAGDGHRPEAGDDPSVMSMATEIAVPCAAPATVDQQDPGHHVGEVARRDRAAGAA